MLVKRCSSRTLALLGSLTLFGGLAQAAVLYTGTVSLSSTDPTQSGRLSRNGTPQDWSYQKALCDQDPSTAPGECFPGVLNSATTYRYETIAVLVPNWLSFLQISLDSTNGNIFGSAYDSSYNPNSGPSPFLGFDTNWLGDAGTSGNFFGTSPVFFQVVDQTAANSSTGFGTLVVVLNETSTTGTGRNSPVNVLVEGFSDTNFNEVPEPVTSTLLGAGILVLAATWRRRAQAR